ncbi:MAG: sigma-54-dependent transcriptional regulator [Planctomycetota bacterium]
MPCNNNRILVADDDPALVDSLCEILSSAGHEVLKASSADEAIVCITREQPDAAFLDLRMPGRPTIDAVSEIVKIDPNLAVLIMTGFGSIELAVGAMRAGAYDFIEKPIRREMFMSILGRALQHRNLQKELARLRAATQQKGLDAIGGTSESILSLKKDILKLSQTRSTTALILGESGVGKELVARALHATTVTTTATATGLAPWVAVNCGALAPALLEAELFGYEKGAFTGADPAGREGLFEQASGGTIFLDEIAEMDLSLQAKLLRALEERSIRRIGGNRDRNVDLRVVAATNRDLRKEVAEGRFRGDLYYRLAVVSLRVAPLRERKMDIIPIAETFLLQYQNIRGTRKLAFEAPAISAMELYAWPGNVRELRNAVERACIVCNGDAIQARDLGLEDASLTFETVKEIRPLAAVERETIARALEQTGGNISKAAKALGIHRATLHRKIDEFELVTI